MRKGLYVPPVYWDRIPVSTYLPEWDHNRIYLPTYLPTYQNLHGHLFATLPTAAIDSFLRWQNASKIPRAGPVLQSAEFLKPFHQISDLQKGIDRRCVPLLSLLGPSENMKVEKK